MLSQWFESNSYVPEVSFVGTQPTLYSSPISNFKVGKYRSLSCVVSENIHLFISYLYSLIYIHLFISQKKNSPSDHVFSISMKFVRMIFRKIRVNRNLLARNNPSSVDEQRVSRRGNVQLSMDFCRDSHSLRIACPSIEPVVFLFFH